MAIGAYVLEEDEPCDLCKELLKHTQFYYCTWPELRKEDALNDRSSCLDCKETLKYSVKYDAYYCEKCDSWKEKKCGQSPCYCNCHTRPDRPSAIIKNESKEDGEDE